MVARVHPGGQRSGSNPGGFRPLWSMARLTPCWVGLVHWTLGPVDWVGVSPVRLGGASSEPISIVRPGRHRLGWWSLIRTGRGSSPFSGYGQVVGRELGEVGRRARELVFRGSRARSRGVPGPLLRDRSVLAFWWPEQNLGDLLSPILLAALLGRRVRWVSQQFEGKVLSTGSILSGIRTGDLVLGSGLIAERELDLPSEAVVPLLRGPLSARCLGITDGRVAFGDPGLLVRDVLPSRATSRSGLGVVPHYTEWEGVKAAVGKVEGLQLIDVRSDPEVVLDQIDGCAAVCSSSLHGIVAAEAYGVPAIWVEPGRSIVGGSFKFRDYFLGTGRRPPEPLTWKAAVEVASCGDVGAPGIDVEPLRSAFASACEYLGNL